MGIRRFFKKQFNLKEWCDFEGLKQSSRVTKNIFKSVLSAHKNKAASAPGKTFEECVNYYQLTEKDLQKQKRFSLRLVYIYMGCSIGLFLYAFYQLFLFHILAVLMTVVLGAVLFLYGLKEYTQVFQIKHRTLKFKLKDCLKELVLTLDEKKGKNE
jgi:hypothetical protein